MSVFPQTLKKSPRVYDRATFDSTGGVYSVIFYPDGRVLMPPSSKTGASVVVKTDMKVNKPQYTIDLSPSGRVFAR